MNCCLKRYHKGPSSDSQLYSKHDFAEVIYTNASYRSFDAFTKRMFKIHGSIHDFVATENRTHFNRFNGEPSADPLFPRYAPFLFFLFFPIFRFSDFPIF